MKPVSVYYCIGVLALSLIPLGASQAQAAELVRIIDDFGVLQSTSKTGVGVIPSTTVGISSNLLGNVNRSFGGNVTLGGGIVTVDADVTEPNAFSVFNSNNRSNVVTTYSLSNLNPINFRQDGATLIAFDVILNDNRTDVIFNFTDADGTVGNIPFQLPGGIFAPVRFSSPFTSAISSGGTVSGLDFTKITAFNFQVNNTTARPGTVPSSDVIIDFIATAKTPEPSSVLGLSALGLLGLMTRKKKKKES